MHSALLQRIIDACLVKQNNAKQSVSALDSAAFVQFVHKFYANVDVDALKSCCSAYGIDFLVHFVMHAWQLIQQRNNYDSILFHFRVILLQNASRYQKGMTSYL